jgi:hypothetical protein
MQMAMAYHEVLSRHFTGGTEENHKPITERSVSQERLVEGYDILLRSDMLLLRQRKQRHDKVLVTEENILYMALELHQVITSRTITDNLKEGRSLFPRSQRSWWIILHSKDFHIQSVGWG